MATRCNIAFYREGSQKDTAFRSILYRHWDGYPDGESGVLADIMHILKAYKKKAKKWTPNQAGTAVFNAFDMLGIERTDGLHGDISYLYKVYPDRVEIHSSWEDEVKIVRY